MRALLGRYKWFIVVAVSILLVVAVSVYLHSRPPRVTVADAQVGSLELRIAASGLVEGESSDLAFEGQGRIADLYAREGDHVSGSQLLARIESLGGAIAPGAGVANDDVIQAPYDGTVVEIYQREGSIASPGAPVLRVVADGARWVTAFIDSDDAAYLRDGQELQCRAGGYLNPAWELQVAAIGSEAVPRRDLPGSSRQVRVRCEPVAPEFPLTPGTEVDVDGHVTMATEALLVPTAAVVHDGSDDWVWLVEGSTVTRRAVRLGPNNFDLVHIREGLQQGQTVAVHGKQALSDGQPVRTTPMPPMRQAIADGAAGGL